jgi:hypothetical protein
MTRLRGFIGGLVFEASPLREDQLPQLLKDM